MYPEYKLLAATTVSAFDELVNEYAQKGWHIGDLQVIYTPREVGRDFGPQYSVLAYKHEGEGTATAAAKAADSLAAPVR